MGWIPINCELQLDVRSDESRVLIRGTKLRGEWTFAKRLWLSVVTLQRAYAFEADENRLEWS